MKPWHVYIVECSDGTLYTGTTTDVQRRIDQHNNGTGAKYTQMRRPVVLKGYLTFSTQSLACKEEYRIKQLSRSQKLTLIESLKWNLGNITK